MPNVNIPGRISIIVPVYNGENYLEESLRSLLSQTYDDLEIVVINDGSTDRTQVIALDVLSSSDRRWRYSCSRGPSAYSPRTLGYTFFRGIAQSTGEYFGIHSHDNISLPDQYQELMDIIGDNAVSYCGFMRIRGSDSSSPFDGQLHMGGGPGDTINDILTNYVVNGKDKIRILTETALIRKESYIRMRANLPLQLDGWDDEIGIILCAFACGDVVYTKDTYLYFRLLDGGNLILDPGPAMNAKMDEQGYKMSDIVLPGGRYNYTQDRMPYITERILERRLV